MRKLYFLVVFVISFATQAQIVNIPDANFKAKLLSANSGNTIASTQTPDNNGIVTSYNSIDTNNDGEIQVSEAALITYLNVNYSNVLIISNLIGIEYFTNLKHLSCGYNQLTNLDISQNLFLTHLYCLNNQLTILDVTQNISLDRLLCQNNQLTSLIVPQNSNLTEIYCQYNQLTSLEVTQNPNLINLYCNNNQLISLNASQNTSLKLLYCYSNQLSTLNVIQNPNLENLQCINNQLSSLNISQNPNLKELRCWSNQISTLDISNNLNLEYLDCSNNQLSYLDCINNIELTGLLCSNNNLLTSLFIKNNNTYWSQLFFVSNPNLNYICADEEDFDLVQQKILDNGYSNCHVNSYCSFVPGGSYYEILGNTKFDSNNSGCDANDLNCSNLNFSITNGTISGTLISNTSGNYSIPVQSGTHTITPVLENPTYFNISPTSFVANFPTQTSPLLQNFCVTPNGIHHDVEVTIIPTNPARPGFDANYTIVYKNKGNQVENGAITLGFNDAVLDFISANQLLTTQSVNSLAWNYINLQPLEARTINLVFNVNSPTETPAVNIGNQLEYTTTITPLTADEFQYDNTSALKQIVVGSYDPNDKICVEGTTVGPDMIGQYVHYVIRFENTGTYPAENIVVKDMIDLAKFDVNTLIPLHSSHDFVTRIAGNKVEFIFEGINLPFDDANNDGYVTFKIKTKSNLVVGDTFSNDANIYFDYNFPITTNTFETTITALKVTDFDFGTHFTLYPNPVKDVFNFQSKDNTAINSIEIYNTLGQVVLAVPNAISTVDVSNLQSGNYFVKVNTDLGVSNTKFIKE